MAIRKFGAKFHTAQGARAAADKLYYYNVKEKEENRVCDTLPLGGEDKIQVSFEQVSYQYEGSNKRALNDISASFEYGKLNAIVGVSGSGKSTLSYVLMRYLDAEGRISFNQYDISKYSAKNVRSLVAYIPQKPYIFQDTVRNNLLLSNSEAKEVDMNQAIEMAGLSKFIQELPNGLDTMLTEIGTNISVGEAQRIAFARAYLSGCPIIIMDETTSALDADNEAHLRETFETLFQEKTVVIIAHRLETVRNADTIFVMEEGSLVERGNHQELLSSNGIYKKLVETWG
jgi:ABC-type multidrug transport system fused ATPase/permease subunit